MKATFTVQSITYADGCTTISLGLGRVGRGDEQMGSHASIDLVGHRPLDIQPGQLVMLTIEPAGDGKARE